MSLHERTSGLRPSASIPQSHWATEKGSGAEELPVSSSQRQVDRGATFLRVGSGDVAELHERLSSSRGSGASTDGVRRTKRILSNVLTLKKVNSRSVPLLHYLMVT